MCLVRLRDKRHGEKARCLVYAAEADIAARRAVREEQFPKTCKLASREPYKAAILAVYDATYQRIRYLERRGARVGLAVPRLRRTRLWERPGRSSSHRPHRPRARSSSHSPESDASIPTEAARA